MDFLTICNFGEVANGTYFNPYNPCNPWLIYPILQTKLRSSGSIFLALAAGASSKQDLPDA